MRNLTIASTRVPCSGEVRLRFGAGSASGRPWSPIGAGFAINSRQPHRFAGTGLRHDQQAAGLDKLTS